MAEKHSTQKPVRDCFKDWATFNAAAIAISNAAGILAVARVAEGDFDDLALQEAINLINDVLTAMGRENDNEVFDYLNRAAAICGLVCDCSADIDDTDRAQAINAAESLVKFVDCAHFDGSVVTSDFARLRKPELFEEGKVMLEFMDMPAPTSEFEAAARIKKFRDSAATEPK